MIRSVLLPNALRSIRVLIGRVAPVVVPALPTAAQLRTVAVGGVSAWAHARRKPLPAALVDVIDAAMADASAGIPQPVLLPPWAVNPVLPATITTRVALVVSGPAV